MAPFEMFTTYFISILIYSFIVYLPVTGASFLVLNGALKTASGLSGKCSIVEDGLMVQILPKKMTAIQQALKTMKNIDIVCGPTDADASQTEVVSIQWVENDTQFNVGWVIFDWLAGRQTNNTHLWLNIQFSLTELCLALTENRWTVFRAFWFTAVLSSCTPITSFAGRKCS